jgi:protease-4
MDSEQNSYENHNNKKSSSGGCLKWFVVFAVLFCIFFIMPAGCIVFVARTLSEDPEDLTSFLITGEKFNEKLLSGDRSSSNKIAVIEISGVITSDQSSWGSDVANSDRIVAELKQAADDDNVVAVILKLNTPGGEVTAADEIYHQIKKLKKDTGKPVIASMGALAASGGVYVAVAADYIIANKLTTTGSIGVIIQTYNYAELLKKVGVKAETYTSGPMKDILNGARMRTPEEKAIIRELIHEVYMDFAENVASGRPKITMDMILNTPLGDGRILSGRQALKKGLVDQLGYFDDAVDKALKMTGINDDDYQVITYKKPVTFSEIFTNMSAPDKKINVNILPDNGINSKLPENGKLYLLPTVW